MNQLLLDYLPLVVFMGIALAIGMALMVAPFLVAVRNPDPEKVSAYECGFNAFDDAPPMARLRSSRRRRRPRSRFSPVVVGCFRRRPIT